VRGSEWRTRGFSLVFFFSDHFEEAVRFVDAAVKRGACLVNCSAGVSRSASVCIAYLMTRKKVSFVDAFATVAKARPEICPNVGFRAQLVEYEAKLKRV
jgi:protein-tyrosine phosphatase